MPASKKGSSPETKLNVKGPSHEKAVSRRSVEAMLEAELERLKRLLKTGYELEVLWVPDPDSKLDGEVKGNRIYIYEEDEDKAFLTLKHEFIDYVVSRVVSYYRDVANMFIKFLNEKAYREKEKLVEALAKLL